MMILRVLKEAKEFWVSLLGLLALNLLSVPISLLLPFPIRYAVDHVLTAKEPLNSQALWIACVLEFSLLLANQGVVYVGWIYQVRLGEKIATHLRLRLFAHVQRLSLQYHDRRGIGELVYQLQNDVASMQSLAVEGLIPFVSTVLIFVSMAVVAMTFDAQLTLLTLLVLPFSWLLSRFHLPLSRARWADVKKTDQGTVDVLQQALGATRVVRAFSQESREGGKLADRSTIKLRALTRATTGEAFFGILTSAGVAAASAFALYLGISHVKDGRISLGDFLVVMAYLAQLLRPLERLSKYISNTQSSLASAERIFALFDRKPETRESSNPVPLGRSKGRLEFRDLEFGYPSEAETEAKIVQSFNFTVAAGDRVAITGPTGSGKTTLLSLLLRFYDPTAGQILLDGIDIRELKTADLRRQFSVVLQDPVLFMGTVAENISYGKPEASHDEIVAAAKLAEIHETISRLPDGYETQVGERGMNLSGGERQRIAIARSFLIDAPILLMDEPTSHLDNDTQKEIGKTLARLQQGRTTLTISHRHEIFENYNRQLNLAAGAYGIA